jgi:peptidoglycan/LPS O-acetylase OafA/YrhL
MGRLDARDGMPVSKASYGMYLCHMIVLAMLSAWLRDTWGTGLEGVLGIWTTPLQIVSTAIGTFIITAIFSTLVQRIPRFGKWIIG